MAPQTAVVSATFPGRVSVREKCRPPLEEAEGEAAADRLVKDGENAERQGVELRNSAETFLTFPNFLQTCVVLLPKPQDFRSVPHPQIFTRP